MVLKVTHESISTLDKMLNVPAAYDAVLKNLIETENLYKLQEEEIRRAYKEHIPTLMKNGYREEDFEIGPENYLKILGFKTEADYKKSRNKIIDEILLKSKTEAVLKIQKAYKAHRASKQAESTVTAKPATTPSPAPVQTDAVEEDPASPALVHYIPKPGNNNKHKYRQDQVYWEQEQIEYKIPPFKNRSIDTVAGTIGWFIAELILLLIGYNVYQALKHFLSQQREAGPVNKKTGLRDIPLLDKVINASVIFSGAALLTPLFLFLRTLDNFWLNARSNCTMGKSPVVDSYEDKHDDFYQNMVLSFSGMMAMSMIVFSFLMFCTIIPGLNSAFHGVIGLDLIPQMGQAMLSWTIEEPSGLLGGLAAVCAIPAFGVVAATLYSGLVWVSEVYTNLKEKYYPSDDFPVNKIVNTAQDNAHRNQLRWQEQQAQQYAQYERQKRTEESDQNFDDGSGVFAKYTYVEKPKQQQQQQPIIKGNPSAHSDSRSFFTR
jgi:hypothetical protein